MADRFDLKLTSRALALVLGITSLAALMTQQTACLIRHDNDDGGSTSAKCSTCHGDANAPGDYLLKAAPPRDLEGQTDVSYPGVGAHKNHLYATNTHGAIACNECHVIPESATSVGHADSERPAELVFGSLAKTDSHAPAYDSVKRSCNDSYCHRDSDAVWTAPRNSDDACGSCHGLPPAAPHPPSDKCSACHDQVVDANKNIIKPELHVDGKVQVKNGKCTLCHGSGEDPAPPSDTSGNVEVASMGVGAHQTHLKGGQFSRALECEECHKVPEKVTDEGHLDGLPAKVSITGVATTDNHEPSWDRDLRRCTDSWCHGPSGESPNVSPRWTIAEDLSCTSCHGAPPAAPHPQATNCHSCHGEVVGEDNKSITNRDRHVDGVVDVKKDLPCNSCHGDLNNAPPKDLAGLTDTTSPGVGAHQTHVLGTDRSRPVLCNECHVVPTELLSTGHVDSDLPAELTFSGVATSNGAMPNYANGSCQTTWCHGAVFPTDHPSGGNNTVPTWTTVDGTQAACGSCHGLPPPAPHPQMTDCSRCHGDVVNDDNVTFANRDRHVDGVVDVMFDQACNACHGGTNNAPPKDISGSFDTMSSGVGAHQTHVLGTERSRAVLCEECHVVPATLFAPGHFDTMLPAELNFTGVALSYGASPNYTNGGCQNTACHGAVFPQGNPSGGSNTTPDWTTVDGSQVVCGSCHALPPPSPHPPITNCVLCHSEVIGADNMTFSNASKHVDGVVEVVDNPSCTSCHGSVNPAPPKDLSGSTSTMSPGVGAHQSHVLGSSWARAVPCGECHIVPATLFAPGHVDSNLPAELTFSGAAVAFGASPVYSNGSCQNTSCHGAVFQSGHLSGGSNTTPVWTTVDGSQVACGSCHSIPPPSPHPSINLNPVCNACHQNIDTDNATFLNPELHVDGNVTFNVP